MHYLFILQHSFIFRGLNYIEFHLNSNPHPQNMISCSLNFIFGRNSILKFILMLLSNRKINEYVKKGLNFNFRDLGEMLKGRCICIGILTAPSGQNRVS